MTTVKDLIIKNKYHVLHWISPKDKVSTAIQKMSDHNLGALIVIENNKIVGVFSEKYYARKLLLKGKSSIDTNVCEVMERKVLYVTPDYDLEECLAIMTNKKIRDLPVIDNGLAVYLLSIDEVSLTLLAGKEFMISSLTQYITGVSEPIDKKKYSLHEIYCHFIEKIQT